MPLIVQNKLPAYGEYGGASDLRSNPDYSCVPKQGKYQYRKPN